jgi:sarcosine oxidase subunit delta
VIVIRCPYCHELKTEDELTYGGEGGVTRPVAPENASDAEWTDYLFMRINRKGPHREHWCCAIGCGQWFKVTRNTVTHEVIKIDRWDESALG